ncbi:dol-P-Glc:Glc(2)Man(9)GlcNAc(2)-PP-Dol alpha-1,2-glucosyltransferase-like [Actinia tenebrosa]|uniref:Dol-P-Glc:Glc(2)Man(9)GlcNAc(2)-PP-Dol alpha-1,2-glucosyltransferase n=1 Tax=Actinia tenebrosa TaxID=6105 RepID=A0A6P8HVY6_ACTTE|nr:dol-P-Glc:Glc(2)Man(9)GlcNAc(2)-PP-Dol alpha-1,2-glucosyltransferase-like [Actinia tenebrosa]
MADAMENVSLFVFLLAVSLGILLNFQSIQPEPYMDEQFHIPQAQKYCQYKFNEWDPMITTLPGLYLVSFVLLQITAFFTRIKLIVICSAFWLRFTNVLFMMGNALVLRKLLLKIHEETEVQKSVKDKTTSSDAQRQISSKCTFTAINISILPVLYFFTFLYYTDVGSTFFVLLMYLLSLYERHTLASLAGAYSIIFRQTNIIWVIFVAGTTAIRTLRPQVTKLVTDNHNIPEPFYFLYSFFNNIVLMIRTLYSYGLIVVGFIWFVIVNKGVVVGDRSSHEACLNFPQIFYFLSFSLFFSSPILLLFDNVLEFLTFLRKTLSKPLRILVIFSALLLAIGLVHQFTYVHKYLLADNRHCVFYVWHKIYSRHWSIRYLLIPLYFYAAWAMYTKLSSKQCFTWQLLFWICVTLLTAPQKLLEFRYFIHPYIMYRVHIPFTSYSRMIMEFILYLSIDAVTIHLFLNKPFYWSHDPNVPQRFMW